MNEKIACNSILCRIIAFNIHFIWSSWCCNYVISKGIQEVCVVSAHTSLVIKPIVNNNNQCKAICVICFSDVANPSIRRNLINFDDKALTISATISIRLYCFHLNYIKEAVDSAHLYLFTRSFFSFLRCLFVLSLSTTMWL